jgi:glycosyltransferase involved in cell wall biosynthesis
MSAESDSIVTTEVIPIPKIVSIDHGKVEQARIRRAANGKDVVLDWPEDDIDRSKLPDVTIITVTRNRRRFAALAIDNWKRIYYPDDKLTWLVVDDSPDPRKDGFLEPLKALHDNRILYYYMSPRENGEPHNVGHKRNVAMGLVKSSVVAFMDDDDYLYDESILSRVLCLHYYDKQAVYCAEIGVYNVPHENSYFLEGYADVPEGSLMCTKQFWERQKFGDEMQGEGRQLVSGQELHMIKIPSCFNMVVLNHGKNLTGSGRSIRFAMDRKMKEKAAVLAPINFWKEVFPSSFKDTVTRSQKN